MRSVIKIGSTIAFSAAVLAASVAGAPGAGATAAYFKGDPTGTVSVEDGDTAIAYSSQWKRSFDLFSSASSQATTSSSGATATYKFIGTNVVWVGQTNIFSGKAEVLLDGVSKGVVDLYSLFPSFGKALWNSGAIPAGTHTLVIKATGGKNFFSLGWGINLDRIRSTPAPKPTIGFGFNAQQFPELAPAGLAGTVTCSRPLPVKISYSVAQGTLTKTGSKTVNCAGATAVSGLPLDNTGLTSGPATITYTTSWAELDQSVTNAPVTQAVTLTYAISIGLTLDADGFRGVDQTFVGGSLSCTRAVAVNLTGTLPSGAVTTQTVLCPSTGLVGFTLGWNVASEAGVVNVTATALTADGTAGVTTTQAVNIA